jgi:endoglucanase
MSRLARRVGKMAGLLGWVAMVAGSIAGRAASQSGQASVTDHARLWQAYANRFISGDGRVIDPYGKDWTTSEGQSYAMFFALVNNDRGRFDMLLRWTESNLGQGDLSVHLPAWSWGQGKDGKWGLLDPNSASDSDLWIAYDLIEAGRLWNDQRYATIGRRMAANIARHEVANLPGFGPALLPGPVGLFKFPHSYVLNPSYMPIFILDRMAELEPAGPWADIAAMYPKMIERSQRGGFAMDWVCYEPGSGFSPCQKDGKKTPSPVGSYDAIRVYLWAGMLPETSSARGRILHALPGMDSYLQHYGAPPEKINSDGSAQSQAGPVGFSAALLPYLKSNSNDTLVAQQMVRLKSQLDEKSNLYGTGYGSGPTYYDQNLALFGSGWMEHKFQFGSSGELLVRWSR